MLASRTCNLKQSVNYSVSDEKKKGIPIKKLRVKKKYQKSARHIKNQKNGQRITSLFNERMIYDRVVGEPHRIKKKKRKKFFFFGSNFQ